jgi:hypothetical protein
MLGLTSSRFAAANVVRYPAMSFSVLAAGAGCDVAVVTTQPGS